MVEASARSSRTYRDRFGIPLRLDFYSMSDLEKILIRGSEILNIDLYKGGAEEIARRSRGTPRIGLRLLRRVRDIVTVKNVNYINQKLASDSLSMLEVDNIGLDGNDYRYLKFIYQNYLGQPVGIDTIAAGLYEQKDTIEETIEPYMIQIGFVQRTSRGRVLSKKAIDYLS